MDGFDHYSTTVADIDRKWDSASAIAQWESTGGRFGGGAVRMFNTADELRYLVSDITTVVMGGAVKMDHTEDSMDTSSILFQISEGGVATHITVGNHQGFVRAKLGTGGGTILGTSTNKVFFGQTWHYVEMKVVLSASATGSVEVHVDGVQVLNLTSIITSNGGVDVIDRCVWKHLSFINTRWDDTYIADSGNILSDVRIDTIMPDGDGNYTEFGTTIPSSPTTHWDKVEELPDDDDTSYNQGTAANQRDTFTMENLDAITTQTIHAVQQFSLAKHDGTATNFRHKVRIAATDYDSTSQALASAYGYHLNVRETNPNTASAWTESDINGMESGVEQL
jgi:hypothetical protein